MEKKKNKHPQNNQVLKSTESLKANVQRQISMNSVSEKVWCFSRDLVFRKFEEECSINAITKSGSSGKNFEMQSNCQPRVQTKKMIC